MAINFNSSASEGSTAKGKNKTDKANLAMQAHLRNERKDHDDQEFDEYDIG